MTRRERGLLILGILAGVALAAGAAAVWVRYGMEFMPGPASSDRSAPAVPEAPRHDHGAMTTGLEPTTVELTGQEQASIGIELAEVTSRRTRRQLEVVGRVEAPETSSRAISARIGGRLDRLFVNYTGQEVRSGQPVAQIYSPEVFTAAEEYRLALANRRQLNSATHAAILSAAVDLVEASRKRLELWGLDTGQIAAIETSSEAQVHITIHATASGIVSERRVSEGQYVREGDVLAALTDLSSVWVKAEVFDSDMASIRLGQGVTVTADAPGIGSVRGQVDFIEPLVNAETRTVPVRIQAPNPGMRLRPGMYVRATFNIGEMSGLAVPRSAVIDTGSEKVVYVAVRDGAFERRAIQTGTPDAEYYPVLGGLKIRERVVAHGAFLIDSQSRLNPGMNGLFGGAMSFSEPQAAGDFRITFRTGRPSPSSGSEETVFVSVLDSSGQPVTDAEVQLLIIMPAMPSMGMPEMRSAARMAWNGSEYAGRVNIAMAGSWTVVVEARRGGHVLARHRGRFDAS